MVGDVWQFLDSDNFVIFYAKCTYVHYATQVFVQTKRQKKERMKKKEIANGGISRDK